MRRELGQLGPVSRGERNVIVAFLLTVFLWVFPGLLAIAGLRESAVRKGLRSRRCRRRRRR
ncbi:MAG: anion permease [Ignavibacteriales bacterium]|nr:anion permease [Ignavibacteriales bacterium]